VTWLSENYKWLFDGVAGAAAVTFVVFLVQRLFRSARPAHQPASVRAQGAKVTKSPVASGSRITQTINETHYHNYPEKLPEQTGDLDRTEEKKALAAHPTEEAQDRRPKLYTLHPRICSLTDKDGGGLTEGGDSFKTRAVLATFRMAKPSADGHDTHLTARLSYRTVTDIGFRAIAKEIHRVNYGAWIDEDFNSVEMTLTDTKELILLLQENGRCVAVQDNRRSVSQCNPPSFYEFVAGMDAFYVDVILVDDSYGAIISFTYAIETSPLTVHEIIRVPKVGS
jgi:hypothetical protein